MAKSSMNNRRKRNDSDTVDSDKPKKEKVEKMMVSTSLLKGLEVTLKDGKKATIVKYDKKSHKLEVAPVTKASKKKPKEEEKPARRPRVKVDMDIFKKGMKITLKDPDNRKGVIVKVDKEKKKLVVQPDGAKRTKQVFARDYVKSGKKIKPRDE